MKYRHKKTIPAPVIKYDFSYAVNKKNALLCFYFANVGTTKIAVSLERVFGERVFGCGKNNFQFF